MNMRRTICRHTGQVRTEPENGRLLLFFSTLFLAGCFLGCVFGGTNEPAELLADCVRLGDTGRQDYWRTLLDLVKYPLAAFLVGTSYYGVLFVPLLCLLRGYAFARTSTYLLASADENGILHTMLVLGLPSLFALSCFFIISIDSFKNARRLFCLNAGKHAEPVRTRVQHALLCVLLLICGTELSIRIIQKLLPLFH